MTTTTAPKDIKIVEVSLPKDFLFFALKALVGVDAAMHLVGGFGITSSLVGTGAEIIALSGVMDPMQLIWGLIMMGVFSVLLLRTKEVKTR